MLILLKAYSIQLFNNATITCEFIQIFLLNCRMFKFFLHFSLFVLLFRARQLSTHNGNDDSEIDTFHISQLKSRQSHPKKHSFDDDF
jgi:hypothetical protein